MIIAGMHYLGWHSQFNASLEDGIKQLVLLLTLQFGWVTYSSCEGHQYRGRGLRSVERRVEHRAASDAREGAIRHTLGTVAAETNHRYRGSAMFVEVCNRRYSRRTAAPIRSLTSFPPPPDLEAILQRDEQRSTAASSRLWSSVAAIPPRTREQPAHPKATAPHRASPPERRHQNTNRRHALSLRRRISASHRLTCPRPVTNSHR